MLTLGIDSGTQSTKTVVLDLASGAILASAQKTYGLIDGLPPGHLEQHPREWLDAVDATVRECLEKIGARRGEVAAIGVSGQQHGLVVLDKNDRVVRPAKLWCDTSTAPQCEQFTRHFGGVKNLIDLAGNAVLPGYTAPKILWLKQNEPQNFAAAASFLLPHDYINFFLTGKKQMEHGDASGTALLDVRKREWCAPLVDFIDAKVRACLPGLKSSREPCGVLRGELQKKWGLGEVVVSAGGGDNMMGAIGTGNVRAGVVTASFGTSGTLYSFSEKPIVDPQGEVAAFCDSTGAWMPLVCTMNVTVATETVRALFDWDLKQLDMAVSTAHPGAGGVLFLPYLTGERTPNLPNGSGAFHGLTPSNMRSENLARAAMEGATLGLAYGLQRLRELGVAPSEIRLTGGGSKSAAWRQIAADVFGVPTVCLASSEGAALGAAVQAAWAHSGDISICQLTDRLVTLDEKTRCLADPRCVEMYAGLLKKQTAIMRELHAGGHL